MANVFLSHSSKDKERYVRIVAQKLQKEFGEHSIIYDEYTFESGMKPLEEIEILLGKTDLFVVFLSKAALASEWVKRELLVAKNGDIVKRIYPIVIDVDLEWNADEIPQWLRDYNLRYVPKAAKAVQLIRKRLVEITWEYMPELKSRDLIFVGRNSQIQEFEERKYDFSKNNVIAYVASGIQQIGRKSFLRHCFIKSNIMDNPDHASLIDVGMYDGIEDFIVYLYDLGYCEDIDLSNFMVQTVEEKSEILARILDSIADNKEVVLVDDEGCIVTHEGIVCNWFIDAVSKMQKRGRTVLGIASKFNIRIPVRCDEIFSVRIPPMDKTECSGLFQKYLDLSGVGISRDDLKNYVDLMDGFPTQVKFAAEVIRKYGAQKAYDYSVDIRNYDSEIIVQLMEPYEKKQQYMEFIMLLVELDMVTYSTIQRIVCNESFVSEIISRLYIDGIIEFYGINREYIKLAYVVNEYVSRAGYKMSSAYQNAINDYIANFLNKYEYAELDMPDYLYKVKEHVKSGEYNKEYMLPSQYLKTMVELYEKDRDYVRVIEFADAILKGCKFIEDKLVFEIRFFLCMALAQKRDRRFLSEVQEIKGADHSFLLGFYYRREGLYERALEEIDKSLAQRKNFSKAKREKVQLLINLEQYDEAIELAKENYINDKKNVYHAHAYLLCMLKTKEYTDTSVIEELISNISKSHTDLGQELAPRCKALVAMYCEKDIDRALALIDDAINKSDYKIYAIQDRFDICEKAHDIDEMKKTINILESTNMRDSNGKERAIVKAKILLAAYEGDDRLASHLLECLQERKLRLNSNVLKKKVRGILGNSGE